MTTALTSHTFSPDMATVIFNSDKLFGVSSSFVGRKPSNEDEYDSKITPHGGLFAIYDGHGGPQISTYLKRNLLRRINDDDDDTNLSLFLELDDEMKRMISSVGTSGSTMTLVIPKKINNVWEITTVNLGDSPAFLIQRDQYKTLITYHNPTDIEEMTRIQMAGGIVGWSSGCNRVCGLAMSRAFGDYRKYTHSFLQLDIKDKGVIAEPSISTHQAKNGDFILIASDGLTEPKEMTPEFISLFLYEKWNNSPKNTTVLKEIAQDLIIRSGQFGSRDNISVTLICLSVENQ